MLGGSMNEKQVTIEAGGEVLDVEISLWYSPYWEVDSEHYERQRAELLHWPDPETGRSRIKFSVEFNLPASAAELQSIASIVIHSAATKQPILQLAAVVEVEGDRLRITPPEILGRSPSGLPA